MIIYKASFRQVVFLLLIAVFMSVATGCVQGSSNDQKVDGMKTDPTTPKKGGTITMAMPEEPDTLDAQKSSMAASDSVVAFLGGGLLYIDPLTQERKPYLAEKYTVSDDGKTWTFTLRSGVTFHDGTPLTAQAFKATFERALSKEFVAQASGAQLSDVKSITAPDDKTLILELKEPSAPLISSLARQGRQQPLSMEAIKKFGDQYGRNPVGVGPWKFESWKTGESITLVRNDAFAWADASAENQGPVRPDKLVIKFIKDNHTLMAALESGSIDIAGVPAKEVKKYKSNNKYTVLEQLKSGLGFFIELNLRKPIFQDINVRKALNMAINKEVFVKSVLQGEGVVADGPLAESNFGYDKSIKDYAYKFDQEEARRLLEASGWKLNEQGVREKDGKLFSVHLNVEEVQSDEAQLVQSMLKEIGVEVIIDTMEFGTLLQIAGNGDFDMTSMGFSTDDPDLLYRLMHSSQIGGVNHSGINNKQLDALLEKGRMTVSNEERVNVYADVQKLAVEQAYWIPIYTDKQFTVINNRVQGVKMNPLGILLFQDSWVNE